MPACQVIITAMNNSERRCSNYARKGLDCCYSHRKLEVENQEEIVANVVNAIFENVIYNVRMDYIREHGWDEYCNKLKSEEI